MIESTGEKGTFPSVAPNGIFPKTAQDRKHQNVMSLRDDLPRLRLGYVRKPGNTFDSFFKDHCLKESKKIFKSNHQSVAALSIQG
ncbi:hypothetical protein, partial [Paenibacillus cymbidii]|uniref:hypothetical protein n=1 Tax=Paenibacillus cymbidii TaxID=1639034 RepID=UPI001A9B1CD8